MNHILTPAVREDRPAAAGLWVLSNLLRSTACGGRQTPSHGMWHPLPLRDTRVEGARARPFATLSQTFQGKCYSLSLRPG